MSEISRENKENVKNAADIIRGSKMTVVLTGAGISTPSGVPDFRSANGGLWQKNDPMVVASLLAFRYKPEKFYEWMRPLAIKIYNAQPNPAHHGLARLEQAGLITTIVTQNIDGLHQRAGSKNVLEVHGSLDTLSCTSCFRQFPSEGFTEAYISNGETPLCKTCGHVLKPDAILMGEQLPAQIWRKADTASKTCDLMIVAGSSLEVVPVAGLPMRALEFGANLIVINHTPTYVNSRADIVFTDDVAHIIPQIVREVLGD